MRSTDASPSGMRIILPILALGIVQCLSMRAAAVELWATQNASNLSFHRLDPSTGVVLDTFFMPPAPLRRSTRDIAADPLAGGSSIWIVTQSSLVTPSNELIHFDIARREVIGTFPLQADQDILTLAIDPQSGDFYGTSADFLYAIDRTDGITTRIGPTVLSIQEGLAFGFDGTLYGLAGLNELVTINRTTGMASSQGLLGISRLSDLAVHPETGTLMGAGLNGGSQYGLFAIDPLNLGVQFMGASVGRPSGLAFVQVPEPNVPFLCHILTWLTLCFCWRR